MNANWYQSMKLYYVHDPMCSWCWAFRPVWAKIAEGLPAHVEAQRVLGGLAPDTDAPMPESTRAYVQRNWRKIQEVAPRTPFNFEFWERCRPRRSTYPACRAVIAAMAQGAHYEEPMILAYYLKARNPSDDDTLIELARDLGLDTGHFAEVLNSSETQAELLRQIEFSRRIGARGFPSLILEENGIYRALSFDYHEPAIVLEAICDR